MTLLPWLRSAADLYDGMFAAAARAMEAPLVRGRTGRLAGRGQRVIVVDASVLADALVDDGDVGQHARRAV